MFDKLGDLLSEALEKGELPKEKKSPTDKSDASSFGDFLKNQEVLNQEDSRPQKKIIPQDVREALKVVSIPEDADFSEAKKIYREKLKYYHPDRRNDNPVLQKIAKEKTAALLTAWERIEKWFKTKS